MFTHRLLLSLHVHLFTDPYLHTGAQGPSICHQYTELLGYSPYIPVCSGRSTWFLVQLLPHHRHKRRVSLERLHLHKLLQQQSM